MAIKGFAHIDSATGLVDATELPSFPIGTVGVLASAAYDFSATSTTPLYTVPAGQTFFLTLVDFSVLVKTNTGNATFSIGSNATSYNNWVSGLTSLNFPAVGKFFQQVASNTSQVFNAGDVINLNVSVAVSLGALSGMIYLVGFLQ